MQASLPGRIRFATVLGIVACGGGRPGHVDTAIHVDTLVSASSETLLQPIDIRLTPEGHILVSDWGAKQLVELDQAGTVVRRIGREGDGPLEFRVPQGIHVTRDSIRLVDAGNGRIMVLDRAGTASRTVSGVPGVQGSVFDFDAHGRILITRGGRGGSLVSRLDADGAVVSSFGRPPVPPTNTYDCGSIKHDLSEGRTPQVLRNHVLPVLGESGTAWLLSLVDGTIEQYSPHDSLAWHVELPDSLLAPIREDLYRLNREEASPGRYIFPTVFVTARTVGNDLWVMLREPASAPAMIAVLDSVGSLVRTIRIPDAVGARRFDVDSAGQRLVLLDTGEGTVLGVDLEARE